MLKANLYYKWGYRVIDGRFVRVAIVVDYPENIADPKMKLLIDSLEKQGYHTVVNYGSNMSYESLMKDIDTMINSRLNFVLFTRRSELLSNEYGRPDTFFKYYDKSTDEKVEFGLASFDSLTDRDIREANNIMRLYWGGTFQLESE